MGDTPGDTMSDNDTSDSDESDSSYSSMTDYSDEESDADDDDDTPAAFWNKLSPHALAREQLVDEMWQHRRGRANKMRRIGL